MASSQVDEGAKGLQVGELIAVMAEEGDDLSTIDAWLAENGGSEAKSAEPETAKEESAPKEQEQKGSAEGGKTSTSMDIPPSKPAVGGKETAQEAPKLQSEASKLNRIAATPIARRIAQEKGVPLDQVKGSGPNGRIVKEDVEKFQAKASKSAAPAASSSSSSAAAPAAFEDIPASNMRKTISKRLLESSQSIPNYFVTVEVNMGPFRLSPVWLSAHASSRLTRFLTLCRPQTS